MLQAIIFDFDGVITDSEILHFRAFNAVLARHGVKLTRQEYYRDYLGMSDVDCFKALIAEGRLQIDESRIGALVAGKTRVFEELARTEGSIIEGVREFLKMLAQNYVRMAICSGALRAEIEMILEEANLRHYFEEIVSAEEVTRGKPHPDGFLLALKKLNSPGNHPIGPSQCVVIEDSRWGLQAANAAGMRTVAVTNTYEADQLTNADKIVQRLDTLTVGDLQALCE